MKKLLSAALFMTAFAVNYFLAHDMSAQDSASVSQFGNRFSPTIHLMVAGDTTNVRERTSQGGILEAIAVKMGEQVDIVLAVPISAANSNVEIAPLDGGEISAAEDLRVGSDGRVDFGFRGDAEGMYRLMVRVGGDLYQIDIYVPPHPDICITP